MKYSTCWLCTTATALLFTAFFSCKDTTSNPPPPPSEPDTTSHTITWQTDTLGYIPTFLSDVWGTSPTSIYAVGNVTGPPPELGKYYAHFDGYAWTPIGNDSLSRWLAGGTLAGIHGISESDFFVMGYRYNMGIVTGFAGHWNGTRWFNISPDSSQELLAVWARSATDVYAAGESGTLLHYDGSRWQRLESGTQLSIWQLTEFPDHNIYAVASDNFNSLRGNIILRIQGLSVTSDWSLTIGRMFGIWSTPGGMGYATGEGTFVKNSGGQWHPLTVPDHQVTTRSVFGTAANNILIVGAFGLVMHWNGSSWKFYDELYDRSSSKSYLGVFAIANKYFLVGSTPYHALVTVGTRESP
jgi:hypothetical protein